ncbi:TonB-dependent receptor [Muricauda sp. SCSIO 64092]|uniref:SusC/RagA family TonB-linked outer membrane protein n=1 Tax=Allomuricauda sp. SCSIO 64092 TaxID=2908842 RepID=UPI001FF57448|nr:TonB-dependent receptor [Muricauda sp. SCSIO 64092]UOY08059.1 TonB-dependent receptor [Muricauda sp. SCSIO 64092]
MEKKCKYLFRITLAVIVPMLCNFNAFAQTVSGTVTDTDGTPLPGATVVVKGTANGTQTDFDGNYAIADIPLNSVLVFSYVGFLPMEETVGRRTTINVSLAEDAQLLDEVVVIGYGSVKKSDLTGAVSSVSADDLTPGANVSLEQTLQGRAAGVQISQKSGQPGSAMSVNIRGASSIDAGNEPLYVIDGVPSNNSAPVAGTGAGFVGSQNPRNPLNTLNPADIESVQILKDASATAIYGARGSNGVVLITTKNGRAGKMKVNYDSYVAWQTVANRFEVLSPTDYRDVLNAIIDEGGGSEAQRVTAIQDNGTDWQDELLRNAIIHNHNIAVSGGSEKATYYASLNYFDQDGIVKNSGIERYNIRVNIDVREDKKYAFGLNLNSSYVFDDFASNGVGLNENAGAVYAAINYDPTITVFDADGNLQQSEFVGPQIDNPVALLNGEDATAKSFRTYGNIYGEYFLAPTLSVKARLGADVNNTRRDVFIDETTIEGAGQGGIASILTGRTDYYLVEGTLNYNENFGDDNINAVFGATYEYFGSTTFNGNARGFALPDLRTDAIGSGDPLLNGLGSGRQEATFNSYLGRVNYSLNNKYLFTASIRADGSSRFGPENRWGYFPSGAIAWKVHEESFLQNGQTISELKLRASYGSIGNASIANYLFLGSFDTANTVVLDSERFTTILPTRIPNPDLKWEAANQLDIGIDFGLWNGRVSSTIDYYNRQTEDLLLSVPQPSNTGFTSRVENVGSMENYGFEFTVNASILSTPDFSWDTNFNLTTITNNVLDIGEAEEIIRGGLGFVNNATITRPGDPLNSYYGFNVEGVWQLGEEDEAAVFGRVPGDLKYTDQNGDGEINGDDRVVIGKPFPDYTWGWTNTIRYKGLTLSAFLEGVEGINTLNNNLVDTYFPINFRRNKLAEPYLNRWTPNNTTNEFPSFVSPQGGTEVNSRTVEDASYIRLQSLQLSYEVPIQNLNIFNRLTVYVTGQNLFTITDYSGVDPVANASGSNNLRIDYNAYPFARTYLLGFNVEF